jgi:predicted anti-sigma-YlaC factor YlaD
MSDQWTDRLSEYADGDLSEAERAAVKAHLETCPECADTLADLCRIVRRARVLSGRPPTRDLWPGIAERIGASPRRRRISFSMPQLLAAGIALAVFSGGGAWVLHPGAGGLATRWSPPAPPDFPVAAVSITEATAPTYASAVGDLERILAEGRGRLDSTTVRVLEQNLALIDQAIAQAQRALAADSANAYLNTHLAETMRRKIDLLRQAAALVSAVS